MTTKLAMFAVLVLGALVVMTAGVDRFLHGVYTIIVFLLTAFFSLFTGWLGLIAAGIIAVALIASVTKH